jgi:hypothetical protein
MLAQVRTRPDSAAIGSAAAEVSHEHFLGIVDHGADVSFEARAVLQKQHITIQGVMCMYVRILYSSSLLESTEQRWQ